MSPEKRMFFRTTVGQHRTGEGNVILGESSLRQPASESALAFSRTLGRDAYDALREVAAGLLDHERPGHTLQPTALVHEAWLKLADSRNAADFSRAEFLAAAASAMRRCLVDHARGKMRLKRGGPLASRVTLDTTLLVEATPAVDPVELDDALERLAVVSARRARIVELRYFGGLTEEETAEALGIARRTVQLEWRSARAWLKRALSGEPARRRTQ